MSDPLPKAVGVYDRPKVRRTTRLAVGVAVVMVVIALVAIYLLR